MFSARFQENKKGFTLIELLVTIAIIAILVVVGMVLFTNVQKGARDARRRSDIDAIAKAYEVKNSSSYQAVTASDFSSGAIPKDPSKGDYFNVVAQDGSGFKACAALDDNPAEACNTPAANCFCKGSTQGNINPGSSLVGSHIELGQGGNSSSSCDTNGTLLSGLVGYWKMDETSWSGTTRDINDLGGGNNGLAACDGSCSKPSTAPGKFGNAGNFDGVDDWVEVLDSNNLDITGSMTISVWIKTGVFQQKGLVAKWGSNGPISYLLGLYPGGKINFRYSYNGSDVVEVASNTSLTDPSKWYHVVAVKKDLTDTTLETYIDEVKDSNVTTISDPAKKSILSGVSDVALGVWGGWRSPYFFNGLMDDVRIYNRALSQAEITALYNSGNGCTP